jgi:hypothetical protein
LDPFEVAVALQVCVPSETTALGPVIADIEKGPLDTDRTGAVGMLAGDVRDVSPHAAEPSDATSPRSGSTCLDCGRKLLLNLVRFFPRGTLTTMLLQSVVEESAY